MDWFSVEWSGEPFVLFSAAHLLALAGVVALNGWLARFVFLGHKPETASLLDALPPWPYYLPWLLIVGVVMVAVRYAPWELADRAQLHHNRMLEPGLRDARGAERKRAHSGG